MRCGKVSEMTCKRDEAQEKWKEMSLEYSSWNAQVVSMDRVQHKEEREVRKPRGEWVAGSLTVRLLGGIFRIRHADRQVAWDQTE